MGRVEGRKEGRQPALAFGTLLSVLLYRTPTYVQYDSRVALLPASIGPHGDRLESTGLTTILQTEPVTVRFVPLEATFTKEVTQAILMQALDKALFVESFYPLM